MSIKSTKNYSLHIKIDYVMNFVFAVLSIIPGLFLINSSITSSGSADIYTGNVEGILNYIEVWNPAQFGMNGAVSLWNLFPAGIVFLAVDALVNLNGQILQLLYISFCFFVGFKAAFALFNRLFSASFPLATFVAAVFYMYNSVVARMLGGTFNFLSSYAFTALFLNMFIKYIQERNKRDLIISAMALAMVFGPNLVFGFVALFGASIYVLYGMLIHGFKFAKNYVPLGVSFVMSIFLIAWWFLPSFLLTRVAADDVATVINSEDFYNLDTGPLNLIRSLGDWSFFSGHKGVPYVQYASHFLKNPIVILGSFIPFLILVWAVSRKNIRKNKQALFAVMLFIPTIFIIGGTNKEWVTSGFARYAFDSVSSLLIFRNTYKFSVLIVIAFSIGIYLAIKHMIEKGSPKPRLYVLIFLILAPAFPLVLNMSASKNSLVDEFPHYWHESAEALNNDDVSRALLLPDQYFSVFNWNGETKSLGTGFESALYDFPLVQNTCVGCAVQRSQDLIQELTLGYEEPAYAKLLRLAGISHIIQRNDYDAGFYGVKNAQAIDTILATRDNINKVKEFDKLSVYKVDSPYPLIYSPKSIVVNNSNEPFSILENTNTEEQFAVVDSVDAKESLAQVATTSYDSLFYDINKVRTSETQIIDEFKTALSVDQNLSVELTNPLFALSNPDSNITISDDVDREEILTSPGVSFDQNLAQESDYLLGEKMIDSNVFKNIPEGPAGDCRPSGEPVVMSKNTFESEGYVGLEISAEENLACVTVKPSKIELNNDYLMWFDYKIDAGNYFGYCMSFDGATCKKKDILIGEPGVWKRHYIEFSTKNDAKLGSSTLFFYAPAFAESSTSTVQYANVEGYQVMQKPRVFLQKNETFKASTYSYDYKTIDYELVPDSEMTGEFWNTDENACGLVSETSTFKTNQLKENGDDIIELESFKALACTNGEPFSVENDATHVLEIDRRVLQGAEYGYCILVGGECLIRNQPKVEDNEWGVDRFLINLNNQTNGQVRLYLYGSESDINSKVQFRNISLKQLSSLDIPKFGVSSSTDETLNQLNNIEFNKSGPSEYTATAKADAKGKSMLIFLQSYSSAWTLVVNGQEIPESEHIPMNYFANGWILDANEICKSTCETDENGMVILHAKITYKPQQILLPSIGISAVSYILLGTYVALERDRRRATFVWIRQNVFGKRAKKESAK